MLDVKMMDQFAGLTHTHTLLEKHTTDVHAKTREQLIHKT